MRNIGERTWEKFVREHKKLHNNIVLHSKTMKYLSHFSFPCNLLFTHQSPNMHQHLYFCNSSVQCRMIWNMQTNFLGISCSFILLRVQGVSGGLLKTRSFVSTFSFVWQQKSSLNKIQFQQELNLNLAYLSVMACCSAW